MSDTQFAIYKSVEEALGITDYGDKLIHYTSTANFEKIIQGGELWFGRLPDLNDTAEAFHFINSLDRAVEIVFGQISYESIKPLVQRGLPLVREKTFVSSWCEYDPDEPSGSLQMWQTYGDDGLGVGIVVDSTQFQPSSINEARSKFFVHSTRVDYVSSEQAPDYAIDLAEKVLTVEGINETPHTQLFAAMLLLVKAPCVKHKSFSHEKEIRFLSTFAMQEMLGQPISQQEIRTIGTPSERRDFAALKLKNYSSYDFDLRMKTMLKKVIVGPGDNAQGRRSQIRSALSTVGLAHIPVSIADIPYRSTRRRS